MSEKWNSLTTILTKIEINFNNKLPEENEKKNTFWINFFKIQLEINILGNFFPNPVFQEIETPGFENSLENFFNHFELTRWMKYIRTSWHLKVGVRSNNIS